jgi:hypothetical protein
MPRADWRRARAFAWLTALLYFDKLCQMPILVARELSGRNFRQIIQAVQDAPAARFPLLAEIRAFFDTEAASIQRGGAEYVHSDAWLGIYWPADEYVFIKLTAERRLDAFYAEVRDVLAALVAGAAPGCDPAPLDDAIRLNRAALKQPFVRDTVTIETRHDVAGFCAGVINNERVALRTERTRLVIDRATRSWDDFDSWCREVVWWGNKKGAYLYQAEAVEPQLAGHF